MPLHAHSSDMASPPNLPLTLREIAAAAARRSQEIEQQRLLIDAARTRLWERMDRLRQMKPQRAPAPGAALADVEDAGLLPRVDPAGSLLEIAAEAAGE